MTPGIQPDLFETQADMFGEDAETPTFRPDLDSVRAELQRIIAEARAADNLPLARLTLYRTIVPQMSLWLPEDEAAQLRFEFDAEMERLEAA